MTSFTVRVLDINGTILPQQTAYLHHILISALTTRNIACPEFGSYDFIAGAGAELTDIYIPAPYAYKINPGDEWDILLHVVNPDKHNEVTYKLEYTMEVGNWTNDFIEVEGYFNSVGGCTDLSDLDFDVPKNTSAASYIIHNDFPSSFTGKFIWSAGHLHRGGLNLYLSRSRTGEILFSSVSIYGDEEHPEFLTSIAGSPSNFMVTTGELLRITAIYDCSEKHKEVMGILFGYVIVDDLYSGNPPLTQVIGNENPFPIYSDLVVVDDESSGEQKTSDVEVSNGSEINSSAENSGESENEVNSKGDKAILGLVGSVGLVLMFLVAVVLLIAAVILFRIKAKRSLEIFD